MTSALATWNDFSGGHWGSKGPRNAGENQWGGANVLLSRDGGLLPVTASRWLEISSASTGTVWGMFYAWGVDGRIYYLQQTASTTFTVKAFTPDPTAVPISQQSIGNITGVATYDADWVAVGSTIYMTAYGDLTYAINTEAGSLATLTGSYGNAPAGRAACLYGERLMIGGISDARFGVHPNRIVFSGDDTNNDPTLRTAWETLNYFDIGADNSFITALLPIRDYLVVMTNDQQVWAVTGVPGSTITARRIYGFHKGSGAVENFQPSHAAVDPSQIRVWFFDHTYRAPSRFNGATVLRTPEFGTPTSDRVATAELDGPLAMLGGPDEFIVNGVALGRGAGEQTINNDLSLVRLNGVNHIMLSDNLDYRQIAPATYLSINGVSGSYASTPQAEANEITGDIDIRCRVAPSDWTPSGGLIFISRRTDPSAVGNCYQFSLATSGSLEFFHNISDGSSFTNSTSSAATGFTDGATHWVRITRSESSGDVVFYTAADSESVPSSWTQLGTTQSTTAGTIFNGTSPVYIGTRGTVSSGFVETFNGKLYRAMIYDGINGALVVDFNASEAQVGNTSHRSETTYEIWTLAGNAQFV